jgi:8-oxo-dGTP pyrophosphatase MutT (NUDIX family)
MSLQTKATPPSMPARSPDPTVDRLAVAHLRFRDEPPVFVAARRTLISDHWSRAVAAKPALFDGTVLIAEGLSFERGRLSATLRPIPFSAFLAWRDWGYPVGGLTHLSAAAAIVSADGAVLLGRMGAHTANAGRIYLVGGTPDLSDVGADGTVDLVATAARELAEETGLSPAGGAAEVLFVRDPPRAVVVAVHRFSASAEDLAADIRRFLANDKEPELADIVVVRDAAAADPAAVPATTRAVLQRLLDS